MKLSDKTYDILAFVGRILLPALAVAYGSLADIWNFPLKTEIVATIGTVSTLILNIFLLECSNNYNINQNTQKELTEQEENNNPLGG